MMFSVKRIAVAIAVFMLVVVSAFIVLDNADDSDAVPAFVEDGIRYQIIKDNDVSVVGNSKNGDVVIPNVVNHEGFDYKVISIGDRAFSNCRTVTSVKVPDSVVSVGSYAFSNCISMRSVEIPDTVETIGSYAFYYCTSLTSVDLPKSSVTISDYVFQRCTSLMLVAIPDTVESIGSYAFYECTSLISIYLPDSIKSIGNYAFSGCTSLTSLRLSNALISIGNYAFSNCTSLILVAIPDTVKTIGSYAFNYCTLLTSVKIPDKTTSVGDNAFSNCRSLKNIDVSDSNMDYSSDKGVLFDKSKKVLIQYPSGKTDTVYVIPESVITISDYAFYCSSSLISVDIPEYVTYIGSSAFYGCTSLIYVKICDKVKSIGSSAFYGCTSLRSVVIPNGIDSIKDKVFSGCSSLGSVSVPSGVKSIESYAFSNCTALRSVMISDSVLDITSNAFAGCRSLSEFIVSDGNENYSSDKGVLFDKSKTVLIQYPAGKADSEYKIPDGVITVGNDAFSNCTALRSVMISDSVKYIGEGAFCQCTSLKSVVIPSNVESLGTRAFSGCASLMSADISGSLTTLSSYTFSDCKSLISVNIPDKVTSIGSSAFSGCTSLASVNIPDKVTSIGSSAFSGCTSITSVIIPAEVGFIGESAFYLCKSLIAIDVVDGNKNYSSDKGVLFDKSKTMLIQYPAGKADSEYKIPDDIVSVRNYAFNNCTFLRSVIISDKVTSIGHRVFSDCASLISVKFPEKITSIGNYAFSGCISLESVAIPGSVLSLSDYSFYGCSSLMDVKISEGTRSIGNYVFSGCTSLKSVDIPDSVTSIGIYAFYNCRSLEAIKVSEGNTKYSSDDKGVLFDKPKTVLIQYPMGRADDVYEIPNTVLSIDTNAFYNCMNIKAVSIPDSVTSIGNYAFYNCTALVSVKIPGSVVSISNYAFYNCTSLTNMEISEGITSIGNYAFYNCTALVSVIIPDSVTSIGNQAFYYCTALVSVKISDKVTSIRNSTFSNCTSLTAVGLPNGLISIGNQAFYYCTALVSVIIPDSVTYIGNQAFSSCRSMVRIDVSENNNEYSSDKGVLFDKMMTVLIQYPAGMTDSDYKIPDTVIFVSNYAFISNAFIKNVAMSDSTRSIGNFSFYGCSSLIHVKIPDSVTSIGTSAFYGCISLKSVGIPNSVMSIGSNAFYNCRSLEAIDVSDGNKEYSSDKGVLFDKSKTVLIQYPAGMTDDVYEVPNTVLSIGEYAFLNSVNLKILMVPDSVMFIGDEAFYNCRSLEGIEVSEGNTRYSSDKGVLFDKSKTVLIQYPAGRIDAVYEITNGVISINDYAFFNCASLTNVTIPESVSSIGTSAFYGCISLEYVKIGEGITSIGTSAFSGCISLKSVGIPNSVMSIGSSAFMNCRSLEAIEVSKGNTMYSSEDGVLFNKSKTVLIQYPAGKTDDDYKVPDTVSSIDINAFYNCVNIKAVWISDNVISIGNYAFHTCRSLKDISVSEGNTRYSSEDGVLFNKSKTVLIQYPAGKTDADYKVPDTVSSIGSYAFYNCMNIKTVWIPDNVTYIGNFVFYSCISLKDIIVSEGNTRYSSGEGVLFNKSKTVLIQYPAGKTDDGYKVPDTVSSIGSYAFYSSTALITLTIPASVTAIGVYSFNGCNLLVEICNDSELPLQKGSSGYGNVALNAVNIYSSASGSSILKEQQLPSGPTAVYYELEGTTTLVTVLGHTSSLVLPVSLGGQPYQIHACAFYRHSLESVCITSGVTSIGNNAFTNCTLLTRVNVQNNTPPGLGNNVFYGCAGSMKVFVPLDANASYKGTDGWKDLGIYSYIDPTVHKSFKYDGEEHASVSAAVYGEFGLSGTNKATDAGDYIVTITPNAGFLWSDDTLGSRNFNWTIERRKVTLTSESDSRSYNGEPLTNDKVTIGGDLFVGTESVTCTVTGSQTDAGTSANTFTYVFNEGTKEGNYAITKNEGTLTVSPRDLAGASITLGETLVYNGSEQEQTVMSVKVNDLVVDTYTVSDNKATDAGSYELTVTGKGNFVGTATEPFAVSPRDIAEAVVTLGPQHEYTGKLITQTVVSVTIDGLEVRNYIVTGNTGLNAGTYQMTVTADESNFVGSAVKDWMIHKSEVTITIVNDTSCYEKSFNVEGKATGSIGLSYSIVNGRDVVSVDDKGVITPKRIGAAVLKITSEETENYRVTEKRFDITITDHDPEVIPGIMPTKTEPGQTEGSDCSICGKYIVEPTPLEPTGSDVSVIVSDTSRIDYDVPADADTTEIKIVVNASSVRSRAVIEMSGTTADSVKGKEITLSVVKVSGEKDTFRAEFTADGEQLFGKMNITLHYDPDKGTPSVKWVEGDQDMDIVDIDSTNSTITFATDHNSTYRIEYKEDPTAFTLGLWIIVAIFGVILLGYLVAMSRP